MIKYLLENKWMYWLILLWQITSKNWPDNSVTLNSCNSYQSYYTYLSTSASTASTVIVHGFDQSVIIGCTSGYLEQEFKELKILNKIIKLRCEAAIAKHINGDRCNVVIHQFQDWKRTEYIPHRVHKFIWWSRSDLLNKPIVVADTP